MFTPSINLRRSPRLASASSSIAPPAKRKKVTKKPPGPLRPAFTAILLDIEGTTTPISFVHSVLFPYVDKVLDTYLTNTYGSPQTQEDIAALTLQSEQDTEKNAPLVSRSDGDQVEHIKSVAAYVRWQMANDEKTTALKKLQGHIWTLGYHNGAFQGQLFPDVARCLRMWKEAGIKLYVYSSGSVEAQQLLFGFSTSGDLCPLFSGYFDTTIGNKRERASYEKIMRELGCPSAEILFVTDIYAEGEAAAFAGMKVRIMSRPGNDRALAKGRLPFQVAKTFDQLFRPIFLY